MPWTTARKVHAWLWGRHGAWLQALSRITATDWIHYAHQQTMGGDPGSGLHHSRAQFFAIYEAEFCDLAHQIRLHGVEEPDWTALRRRAALKIREADIVDDVWARRDEILAPHCWWWESQVPMHELPQWEAAWTHAALKARFRRAWAEVCRIPMAPKNALATLPWRLEYLHIALPEDLSEGQKILLSTALHKRLKYRALDERYGAQGRTWMDLGE